MPVNYFVEHAEHTPDGYPESMLDKDDMADDIGEWFEVRQDRS